MTIGPLGCVWYVGRDGTERDEAFRPAFGAPKMGGTRCSTGQILGVFASHLPPLERVRSTFVEHKIIFFWTTIPLLFFINYIVYLPFSPVTSLSSTLVSLLPSPFHILVCYFHYYKDHGSTSKVKIGASLHEM